MLDKLGSMIAREKCSIYADIYDRIHRKMTNLWKIRDSRQQSKYFVQTTGKVIIPPHRIRWLGTNDAVSEKELNFFCLFLRFV